ncbi:MAG: glucose-1-phosphate thymidylyltransferase, partial [Cyclobacteriaceae bacterium]
NFIPSFTWGGINGFTTFRLQQVFDVAQRVVARRNMDFPDTDRHILEHIFEISREHRTWEKNV